MCVCVCVYLYIHRANPPVSAVGTAPSAWRARARSKRCRWGGAVKG